MNLNLKQSYESIFKEVEQTFRPRENYTHNFVINELSYIVSLADKEIKNLRKREVSVGLHSIALGLVLGLILGSYFVS